MVCEEVGDVAPSQPPLPELADRVQLAPLFAPTHRIGLSTTRPRRGRPE